MCVSQWLHICCGDSLVKQQMGHDLPEFKNSHPLPLPHHIPHTTMVHINIQLGGGRGGHGPPVYRKGSKWYLAPINL